MLAATSIIKFPVFLVLALSLAVGGCAKKDKLPDNSGQLGLNSGSEAPGSPGEFTTTIGDRVFFETDSTLLTATARQTLTGQAQWLLRYPNYPITIEGHADERGTREYNMALGERRAVAVARVLMVSGVKSGQIETISYGEEKPAMVGHNRESWAQNRRVELKYVAH